MLDGAGVCLCSVDDRFHPCRNTVAVCAVRTGELLPHIESRKLIPIEAREVLESMLWNLVHAEIDFLIHPHPCVNDGQGNDDAPDDDSCEEFHNECGSLERMPGYDEEAFVHARSMAVCGP